MTDFLAWDFYSKVIVDSKPVAVLVVVVLFWLDSVGLLIITLQNLKEIFVEFTWLALLAHDIQVEKPI